MNMWIPVEVSVGFDQLTQCALIHNSCVASLATKFAIPSTRFTPFMSVASGISCKEAILEGSGLISRVVRKKHVADLLLS